MGAIGPAQDRSQLGLDTVQAEGRELVRRRGLDPVEDRLVMCRPRQIRTGVAIAYNTTGSVHALTLG